MTSRKTLLDKIQDFIRLVYTVSAKATRPIWMLVLASVVVFVCAMIYFGSSIATGAYIAYVGRYSTPEFDSLNQAAIAHSLASTRFGNRHLDLRQFSLKDYDSPANLYDLLRKDEKCVAVIDNTWGKDLARAKEVIAASSLPVIAINADKAGLDYKNRVAFIGHDDHAWKDLSLFAGKRHSDDYAIFIGEEEYWSTQPFIKCLRESGVSLPQENCLILQSDEPDDTQWANLLTKIKKLAKLSPSKSRVVFFLNTHQDWGKKIILGIEEEAVNPKTSLARSLVFASSPAFSSVGPNDFRGNGGVRVVLITSPRDALTPATHRTLEVLRVTHGKAIASLGNPGYYVKKCQRAVEMLRFMTPKRLLGLHDEKEFSLRMRQALVDRFLDITREGQGAVSLSNTALLFDSDLLLINTPRLELHDTHGATSYHSQLSSSRDVIPNIYVGLSLTDIRNIDIEQGTFVAEFNLSVRFDSSDAKLILKALGKGTQRWNPGEIIQFPDIVGEANFTRIGPGDSRGTLYAYRCTGTFSCLYDASEYPFDAQSLRLRVGLQLPASVAISYDEQSFGGAVITAAARDIPGWQAPEVSAGIQEAGVAATVGTEETRSAQLTAIVRIQRSLLGPSMAVAFPLISMGVCACMLLMLRDLSVKHVGDMSIGLFIGFVAYAVSYTGFVPSGASVSRADWLMFATAFAVLAQLLFIITGNAVASNKMRDVAWLSRVRIASCAIVGLYSLLCAKVALGY